MKFQFNYGDGSVLDAEGVADLRVAFVDDGVEINAKAVEQRQVVVVAE